MIRKLSVYIGEYKKYLLLAPVFVFLDVICELSMPLLMSRIVDVGIPALDIGYIVRTGLLMGLLALLAICFGIMNMKISSVASMGIGANIRDALFNKVQGFSFKNIDKFSTASLITRMTNDVNNLQMTTLMTIRIMLRAPMMLVVALVLAYSINARLSLVLWIAIPLLIGSVLLIMRSAIGLFTAMQGKIDLLNRVLQENLIAVRVVKSFVRYDFEKEKFKLANDDLTAAAVRAVSLVIIGMPVMMLVMNGATLAIIWMGGGMVYAGTLGVGELISFISYVIQILMSVMMISMIIIMAARAKASGDRVVEVLDTEVDIVDAPTVASPASPQEYPVVRQGKVEFRNVCFKYSQEDDGENVLQDISFSAEPGQVIGLVGGTGAGKSTLVHLIPRLYDASEGQVLVDGVDVRSYRLHDLRAGIGMVLQKNTLFSGTIQENLLWGNENAAQERIESACKDAQAHDFILSFPNGYETELGQGGVNVSGGQKQRLCIARAMIKQPKILILDDSTSAVDSATEAKIREAFRKSQADTTVFIIAQRISSVREADQILVLDDGKIVGCGTHKELLKSNAVYQEINSSQQEGVFANG